MIWSTLEILLFPIIWIMERVLELYLQLSSSAGLSVVLLSITAMIVCVPLQRRARAMEARISARMQQVGKEVRALDAGLTGEARFHATETVYKAHGYHPIQSIGQGATIFALLPVLLSAVFVFSESPLMAGKSFLFVPDLSEPDGALGGINLLPFIMTGITFVDAAMRFRNDKGARLKFYIVAVALFALVYSMPASLVLYWSVSNVFSCLSNFRQGKKN